MTVSFAKIIDHQSKDWSVHKHEKSYYDSSLSNKLSMETIEVHKAQIWILQKLPQKMASYCNSIGVMDYGDISTSALGNF